MNRNRYLVGRFQPVRKKTKQKNLYNSRDLTVQIHKMTVQSDIIGQWQKHYIKLTTAAFCT